MTKFTLITFLISFLVSLICLPICRFLAIKYRILDRPNTDIKTHKKTTPYLGGVAIWLGWIAGLLFARLTTNFPTGTLTSLRGIIVGSSFIALIGLIDDIVPGGLHFSQKFVLDIIATFFLILYHIRIRFIQPDYLAVVITFFWVVGITNAFNIIDIMDGLSSSTALVASLAFLFISFPTEQFYVNLCAAALAGALLAFIPFNLSHRRKIFMGDTGSLTIGFILSALSLGTTYTHINNIGIFAPILILAIPIFDTFLVIYARWRKGQLPFLGSKDHYALRLEKMGYSRRQILLFTIIANIILAEFAYLVINLSWQYSLIVYGLTLAAALGLARRLLRVSI